MLAKFQEHIENQFPELKVKKFLLACSGGLDSVVLAKLCHKIDLDFDLAHCNFNLRGAESDHDENFVKNFANDLGIRLFVNHFDTIGYVNKNKVSVEMAARDLRYAWFAELMKENTIDILVTAHHADDALETFLINLSRGTGIDGLKGIPSKTSVLARPLLPFSREEILSFAESTGLKWCEDSTNQDTVHLRNKIRHEVVPNLKELHPTFLDNFQMTQRHLADTSKLLSDYIALLKADLFQIETDFIRIPISKLVGLNPLKTYLFYLLSPYGFTAWNDIKDMLTGPSGKEVQSHTHRLVHDRDYLLLEELNIAEKGQFLIQKVTTEITTPINLVVSEVDSLEETSENILYVDKSTLKYPLVVRNWKKGDYFYPFGMTGKKKLSKYFKDEKVDVISKHKQWLLCSGEDIVWVIGKRTDNRFKVKPSTKQILRFTWIK